MKRLSLIAPLLLTIAAAQDARRMTKGVSVEMPTAAHAVEVRAADDPGATVVAITADGKLYLGATRADAAALANLSAATVYVKADARTPYQNVLAVLDALRGKAVVLLAAPPAKPAGQGIVSPYGIPLTVAR